MPHAHKNYCWDSSRCLCHCYLFDIPTASVQKMPYDSSIDHFRHILYIQLGSSVHENWWLELTKKVARTIDNRTSDFKMGNQSSHLNMDHKSIFILKSEKERERESDQLQCRRWFDIFLCGVLYLSFNVSCYSSICKLR